LGKKVGELLYFLGPILKYRSKYFIHHYYAPNSILNLAFEFFTVSRFIANNVLKYGPSVFKNNSRTYLFNRSKSINEEIKECEDEFWGAYGKRKLYNKTFDDPHFMEYYLDYKCVLYKYL
jgi:hypothetical protein